MDAKLNLKNVQIVVLAAYLAGAVDQPLDTEDIAVKAHSLAPERFSWRKYPEQINLEAVRKRLYDARNDEKGAMLEGSEKEGWSLTNLGMEWAEKQLELVKDKKAKIKNRRVRLSGREGQRYSRERQRILTTKAFKLYMSGKAEEITHREAESVFRIDEYVSNSGKATRITRALNLFRHDQEIRNFLQLMASQFEKVNKNKGG